MRMFQERDLCIFSPSCLHEHQNVKHTCALSRALFASRCNSEHELRERVHCSCQPGLPGGNLHGLQVLLSHTARGHTCHTPLRCFS